MLSVEGEEGEVEPFFWVGGRKRRPIDEERHIWEPNRACGEVRFERRERRIERDWRSPLPAITIPSALATDITHISKLSLFLGRLL